MNNVPNFRIYFVYILASKMNGVLYIGVTNNVERRMREHRSKKPDSFVGKYDVTSLVYYEQYNDINIAIANEKKLKHLSRKRKLEIIHRSNPAWEDLSAEWLLS